MACAATFPKLRSGPRCHNYSQTIDPARRPIKFCNSCSCQIPSKALHVSGRRRSLRNAFLLPVSAVGSGRGSSVAANASKKDLSLENVKTSIVSRNDEKINVRVQLPGKATQKVFDEALEILGRNAPPVPGFRKTKGGKSSEIPSGFLLQILGESRVTKFVLQEILSITIGDFVKKENLKVNPMIETTQSEAEMESSFKPGSAFGFNVILQLEKSDTDEDSEQKSDTK